MNKNDLTREIADRTNFTYKDTAEIVNTLFQVLTEHIIEDTPVVIHNFGTFCLQTYESSIKGNLIAGKIIEVPKRKLPKLKYSRGLKTLVKNRYKEEVENAGCLERNLL